MDGHSVYGVLCPLVTCPNGEFGLLFEVRAASLRRQPNEVCFPGGRMEQGESPTQTAIRETYEELGLPSCVIIPLGELDYITHPSGFAIHPVLAHITHLDGLCPSKDEVDHVFIVPLSFFRHTQPQSLRYDLIPNVPVDFPYDAIGFPNGYDFSNGFIESPVWNYQGHSIWGMTARIVRHFLDLVDLYKTNP